MYLTWVTYELEAVGVERQLQQRSAAKRRNFLQQQERSSDGALVEAHGEKLAGD